MVLLIPFSVMAHFALLIFMFLLFPTSLKLQLLLAGQITDHDCRIILESDSCSIQDHRTGTLVGSGRRLRDPSHLWELDWLHLPSASASSRCQSCSTADATAFATTTAISFAQ